MGVLIQELAKASVWELEQQDVPGILLIGGRMFGHIGGILWVSSPLEVFLYYRKYQLGFLMSSFAFNLTNLFVFTPMTIEIIFDPYFFPICDPGDTHIHTLLE
ncbi:hypothetical protein PIB30_077308 [Stylosanthes scabra]|uniref:Uncharacterized protein n=1 Tax=Stylosanthes scabra TaxID=79078 RepID=A0ABU6XT15_9FABA|nr:hypothetical protein [Stylosanthes scabra]